MRSDRISIIIVGLALLVGGCQTAHVSNSLLPRLAGNDPAQQMDFWHELAVHPITSNDEGFHGLLLYLDNKDDAANYDGRVAELKSRGLLPAKFNKPADAALEHGTLAVVLVKSLNLKGGLSMHLFGANERYSVRELEEQGIYPTSSANQAFAGAEFVGIIGKVQDFVTGNPADVPAAIMPAEPALAAAKPDPTELVPWTLTDQQYTDPILLFVDPTTGPTDDLKVVVTDVQGQGFVRDDENKPWKPATKGMELTKTAEFRTGPKGTIQFKIMPDQTVSVDRLSTLKIVQLINDGAKTKTDLGIQYGRARYDLDSGGSVHESTLHSPNATLAVRGTKVSLYDQRPYPPEAVSLTGTAEFRNMRRQRVLFGKKDQGKTRVTNDEANPAKVALGEGLLDPNNKQARTASEAQLIATILARGGNVTFDRGTGMQIVRGGSPPTDSDLVTLLPGALNFIVRWDSNVNIDAAVITPDTPQTRGGEFIYPAPGLNISRSGGKTAFDHKGGPNGGVEVIYWPKNYTTGVYGVAAYNLGKEKTGVTIDAYANGQKVQLFGNGGISTQVKDTAFPGDAVVVAASVGRDFPTFDQKKANAKTGFVGPLPISKTAVKKK